MYNQTLRFGYIKNDSASLCVSAKLEQTLQNWLSKRNRRVVTIYTLIQNYKCLCMPISLNN